VLGIKPRDSYVRVRLIAGKGTGGPLLLWTLRGPFQWRLYRLQSFCELLRREDFWCSVLRSPLGITVTVAIWLMLKAYPSSFFSHHLQMPHIFCDSLSPLRSEWYETEAGHSDSIFKHNEVHLALFFLQTEWISQGFLCAEQCRLRRWGEADEMKLFLLSLSGS
jgi:hypothetical protein